MEFGFSKEQEELRLEVRSFLEDEVERGTFKVASDGWIEGFSKEFSKGLSAKGWIGVTWPREYGGGEMSYIDRTIIMEELLSYQAPTGFHFFADRQCGPAILEFGSEEQKKFYLPRIIAADISFSLGLSEPNAGSDLASVRTTAEEREDCFVINGQKVWTTYAHEADYLWVLARTDPNVPKHKGLSQFIVDLKTPGIAIRPIINAVGVHSFNEVFFEDVEVPKENLVGLKNQGFKQILSQVDYERAGLERLMQNYPLFSYLKGYVKKNKELREDPLIRDSMARLEVEYQVGWLFCYKVAWILSQGKIPNYEAAYCKAYCSQFEQRLSDVATRILGLYGILRRGDDFAPFDGDAAESYLWSTSYTIQGGAVEILKNIVAIRGLGLPVR